MKNRKRIVALAFLALMSLVAFGCDSNTKQEATTNQVESQDSQSKAKSSQQDQEVAISIYLAKADASGLTLKTVKVDADKAEDPMTWVAEAMDADRQQEYPIFKKDMKVKSIKLDGATAIVDVNDAFVTAKRGELTTQLQIAALVNTIIKNNKSVDEVKFTHNGKKLQVIGSYDVSNPLKFMSRMVKD